MNVNLGLALLVLYPFLGGISSWIAGRKNETYRDRIAVFVAVTEFLLTLLLILTSGKRAAAGITEVYFLPGICGFGLHFTLDGFRMVYAAVAAFMWMMTTVLSGEYFLHHGNRNRFYLFLLLTLGATMGVFLSSDLYTTFIFFEIMSFTSYVWVAQEENEPSLQAAATYLGVAVLGGLVMLMGIFLVYHELGTLEMAELLAAAGQCENKTVFYVAGGCMLFGFGAKAGAFPLHIWLPKAHPVAPAPASALLSGILTKTGIFGILVVSSNLFLHDMKWGLLLLGIGVLTMFGGAMLAVFSIDLKRTLACSSMSQIGFIMVGIGMQGLLGEENVLAVHGTLLHMVNHSMIKLVLFMAAGVIYMNTHSLDLNEIRGYGRKKPLLKIIFLIGALAIGGIPLFGGYISKTLLHESIVEFGGGWIMKLIEYTFLFSGGLTVAYMTKLFGAIFVEKNTNAQLQQKYDQEHRCMNGASTFALGVSALVLFVWGLFPHRIMDRVAALGQGLMHLEEAGETVAYFSLKNLSGAMISIGIGVLVYVFFIRKALMTEEKGGMRSYVNRWPSWLDLENLIYRPLLLQFLPWVCELPFRLFDKLRPIWFYFIPKICHVTCRFLDSMVELSVVGLRKTVYKDSPLPHELTEGNTFTLTAGRVLNFFQAVINRTWRRKAPVQKDYIHLLAVRQEEIRENNRIIGRSLSFGLMLFCIGLCLTLIYLIVW